MVKTKGAFPRVVDRASDLLARRGPGSGLGGFARPGFGNIRHGEGFGQRSMLQGIIPENAKPVPVILGTVVGVGLNTVISRLLESPKVGLRLNPLLARVILAAAGVVTHVVAKKNFTLGLMIGQFPALVDAGVSALMDMALGETVGVAGLRAENMGRINQEALQELSSLRKQLEEGRPAPAAGKLPASVAIQQGQHRPAA